MINNPDMPATFELTREVADHELLLVFNSDDDAIGFREWLEDEGFDTYRNSLTGDDVHIDWHMTPAEWQQLREVLSAANTPYIQALKAAGKLDESHG